MNYKSIIFFFLFICLNLEAKEFLVDKVVIKCKKANQCKEYVNTFKSLERSYLNIEHFSEIIKLYVANEGVKNFSYELVKANSERHLIVSFLPKLKIYKVLTPRIDSEYSVELPTILSIKEGDYYDDRKVKQASSILKDVAKDKGFPNATINAVKEVGNEGVTLGFNLKLNKPVMITEFSVNSSSDYLKNIAIGKLSKHMSSPYDLPQVKVDIEELKFLFQGLGYYIVDLNLKFRFLANNRVSLFLDIINPLQVAFNIQETYFYNKSELKKELATAMINSKRELSSENIESILREKLEKSGFKYSKYSVKTKSIKTLNKDSLKVYSIKIKEGVRSKASRISFKGNTFFSNKKLKSLYYENAFEQAGSDIYDPVYYENYANLIRELYISSGFVSVFIDKPYIQFDSSSKLVNISFRIREGLRSYVSDININGLSESSKEEVLKVLDTNVGSPFNPIQLKVNLDKALESLKNSGFYYSKLFKAKNIVSYESDNTEVRINLNFAEGPKLYAGDIIIIGNYKTRKRLIIRELAFKKNSLITSDIITESKSKLMALGLFSSVQIKPVSKTEGNTDILIFLKEKDFGSIEIAPGIRTDLGFKLSTNISYNNIDGLNKRITFEGTINRRFDLNSLDDTRRQSSKVLLEYDTSIRFSEKKILRSSYDFTMGISKARKRFYSFDADIQRVSYTVSQDYTRWLSASIRQQVEQISQFEATDSKNEENFQLGSITPALTFDFRNRPVNPSSGAIFDLSYELANPTFLSQDVEGKSIDYYKIISRNRFYIPVGQHWVFALSTAFGLQENNRGEDGYIPSIKVFRLSGADIVRGFEDEEINRLITGEDISQNEVNTRAYMTNLKFEPRYYLSDTTIMGAFYDAGRVFVDEFKSDELRSSVGLTFKYVTPVGTLDFDYGIKLLRKRNSSGNLEAPGRLHVSIGFF